MKHYFSKHLYVVLVAITMTAVYMNFVVPDIEQPVTIIGFFVCLSSLLFSIFYTVLTLRFKKYPVALLSGIGTLAGVYLIALRTIGSLDLVDIAIVAVVVTLMIQLLVLQKKR